MVLKNTFSLRSLVKICDFFKILMWVYQTKALKYVTTVPLPDSKIMFIRKVLWMQMRTLVPSDWRLLSIYFKKTKQLYKVLKLYLKDLPTEQNNINTQLSTYCNIYRGWLKNVFTIFSSKTPISLFYYLILLAAEFSTILHWASCQHSEQSAK